MPEMPMTEEEQLMFEELIRAKTQEIWDSKKVKAWQRLQRNRFKRSADQTTKEPSDE